MVIADHATGGLTLGAEVDEESEYLWNPEVARGGGVMKIVVVLEIVFMLW